MLIRRCAAPQAMEAQAAAPSAVVSPPSTVSCAAAAHAALSAEQLVQPTTLSAAPLTVSTVSAEARFLQEEEADHESNLGAVGKASGALRQGTAGGFLQTYAIAASRRERDISALEPLRQSMQPAATPARMAAPTICAVTSAFPLGLVSGTGLLVALDTAPTLQLGCCYLEGLPLTTRATSSALAAPNEPAMTSSAASLRREQDTDVLDSLKLSLQPAIETNNSCAVKLSFWQLFLRGGCLAIRPRRRQRQRIATQCRCRRREVSFRKLSFLRDGRLAIRPRRRQRGRLAVRGASSWRRSCVFSDVAIRRRQV
eukprot:TRINITY_DN13912_c0_g1_i1.p1 TRINITY_DN13912_c0_g1~~TRINITY_DN13912_c0_g1_i1.p1  ORF type:complete len:313 (-),score=38.10 TRINITY_DN13912_c0_g1_i1:228-1166(-)